ncbi:MAG TPA: hypothetical protein DET46_07655 [Comamonadaceae bacterium]|nr:hypothetical protein [Comamonadaceae bacterium]
MRHRRFPWCRRPSPPPRCARRSRRVPRRKRLRPNPRRLPRCSIRPLCSPLLRCTCQRRPRQRQRPRR